MLDADVLVPILSCDLLLCSFDRDLYRPVVTQEILGEVERTLASDFSHLDPAAVGRRARQVAETLALHIHLDAPATEAVAVVNVKDRHVAAVAVATEADVVVSNDRRLRRQIDRLGTPLRAVSGDEFMVDLLDNDRDGIDTVIDVMVAKRVRRPVTRDELTGQLAHLFPRFAARLGHHR